MKVPVQTQYIYLDVAEPHIRSKIASYADDHPYIITDKMTLANACVFMRYRFRGDDFGRISDCRAKYPDMPIIALSMDSTEDERIELYERGIDAHATYPLLIEEIYLRINVFTRRRSLVPDETLEFAGFKLDYMMLTFPDGKQITLTLGQYRILSVLFYNGTKTSRRKEILQHLYGRDGYFESRCLDVMIYKIKQIFINSHFRIVTNPHVGWHLEERPPESDNGAHTHTTAGKRIATYRAVAPDGSVITKRTMNINDQVAAIVALKSSGRWSAVGVTHISALSDIPYDPGKHMLEATRIK